MQNAVQKGHVAVRRNHIDGVRLNRHAVFHFMNRHFGVASDQFGQDALVFGIEMLDEDEGHARVRGRMGEELLEGFQSSG